MSEAQDRQWHVDKKVPLALIMTIIGQTVVAAWGASNLWTRVGELERQMQLAAPQFERIIRLETKVDGITGSLSEIKALINRRIEQKP
ncbi:MAG TPA: hypothetical protein VKT99_02030 [Xanthobacteraceae bacterium]|jgi:hypothetical protein|nr:hypothetical protein [Xanthobacteraceae bacterium]